MRNVIHLVVVPVLLATLAAAAGAYSWLGFSAEKPDQKVACDCGNLAVPDIIGWNGTLTEWFASDPGGRHLGTGVGHYGAEWPTGTTESCSIPDTETLETFEHEFYRTGGNLNNHNLVLTKDTTQVLGGSAQMNGGSPWHWKVTVEVEELIPIVEAKIGGADWVVQDLVFEEDAQQQPIHNVLGKVKAGHTPFTPPAAQPSPDAPQIITSTAEDFVAGVTFSSQLKRVKIQYAYRSIVKDGSGVNALVAGWKVALKGGDYSTMYADE